MTLIQKIEKRLGADQTGHYDVVNCACGERFLFTDRYQAVAFKDRLVAEHTCLDKCISITILREYLITHPAIGANWLQTGSIY